MSYRIFLAEDELNLNEVLTSYLKHEGWEVTSFLNGKKAQEAIPLRPHLWILDIMLPDIDGYQLLKEIKADVPKIPVIYISARDHDLDRILGLELGSDDYLTKPFLPKELVIRTRKILERVYQNGGERGEKKPPVTYGEYVIYVDGRRVFPGAKKGEAPSGETALSSGETHPLGEIELTSKEFDLLLFFLDHAGQALSREQILAGVWGEDYFGTDRAVDDLIRRLRKKMPGLNLETIYGHGYRLGRG